MSLQNEEIRLTDVIGWRDVETKVNRRENGGQGNMELRSQKTVTDNLDQEKTFQKD